MTQYVDRLDINHIFLLCVIKNSLSIVLMMLFGMSVLPK